MVRNSPEIALVSTPASPPESGVLRWDFSDGDPSPVTGTWHATRVLDKSTQGTLTVVADGAYAAPVVGKLGPVESRGFQWMLARAKHEGPVPATLLVNSQRTAADPRGESRLGPDFETYAIFVANHKAWREEEASLALRWGYGQGQPTDRDRITLDWVELRGGDHLVYDGRVRRSDTALAASSPRPAATPASVSEPPADAPRPSLESFFAPAPVDVEHLPVDGIYPQGQTMGLSLYSVGAGMRSDEAGDVDELAPSRLELLRMIKRDGFTLIGPQYELNDRAIEDAKSVGLKCIYSIGVGKKDLRADNPDLEAFKREVQAQLAAVADEPTIAWWNLRPEELRYWRQVEIGYLKSIYELVRQGDPLHRPAFMYEPGHRTAAGLGKTLDFQDLSAKGSYVNYSGHTENRVWMRWSIEQQVEAIRQSDRPDRIAVVVPEMFRQPEPDQLADLDRWARHDMYLGLVSGARGAMIFSLRPRANFTARKAYYEAYAKVTRELRGSLGLERLFLFGTPRHDLRIEVTEGPPRLMLADKFGAALGHDLLYPSVALFDVALEDKRYLILVNSANDPIEVEVKNFPLEPLRAESLFDESLSQAVTDGAMQVRLPGLGVAGWRFHR